MYRIDSQPLPRKEQSCTATLSVPILPCDEGAGCVKQGNCGSGLKYDHHCNPGLLHRYRYRLYNDRVPQVDHVVPASSFELLLASPAQGWQ